MIAVGTTFCHSKTISTTRCGKNDKIPKLPFRFQLPNIFSDHTKVYMAKMMMSDVRELYDDNLNCRVN